MELLRGVSAANNLVLALVPLLSSQLFNSRSRPGGSVSNAAEQRDELAPFHCPMPPVLPTERIAHLGTADCCIHPPGWNEMIAITPPKIFSKEVAQKQATPLTAPATSLTTKNRFTPNFRGWRLDEFSIFARPPPRGARTRPP